MPPERRFSIVLHDVAPATLPALRRFVADLEARVGALPYSWLVVPYHHRQRRIAAAPELRRCLDARLVVGDELWLHGYTHRDEGPPAGGLADWWWRRHYTAGEGEFFAIDQREASRRLERGLAAFADLGWSPAGFVAPAWLLGAPARAALAAGPLSHTALRTRLLDLAHGRELPTAGLTFSARSALRRGTSHLWLRRLRARLGQAPRVRLEVHPGDLRHPSVRAFWLNTIAALRQTHRPVCKRALWLPPT